MEYIYAAMLLHSADKKVTEDSVKDVLGSANVDVEQSRVKSLVAALEDVDMEEAIESAQMAQATPAAETEVSEEASEETEEEKAEEEEEEEEEEEDEEAAAEGLGALFDE